MAKKEAIQKFVAGRIYALERMGDESGRKALLAQLRRGVGKKPGELPQLWGVLLQELPEELMGKSPEPSAAEWAVYTALTLYAYHQQGRDATLESMNHPKQGIGQAAALLVKEPDDLPAVQARFNRFALAADLPQAVTHLRSLVSLLRREGIGLDYGILAGELYRYQFQEAMSDIRLQWGRDFYRYMNADNKEDNENE